MEPLIHCIYASAAASVQDERALQALLQVARTNNARLCVTGMLLYDGDSFFQVLEGTQESVDRVYQKIVRDPRHRKVTLIIREPIAQRSFGEWSMGYRRVSALESPGLNDALGRASSIGSLSPGRAKKLLTAFRSGRWHLQPATATASSARPRP